MTLPCRFFPAWIFFFMVCACNAVAQDSSKAVVIDPVIIESFYGKELQHTAASVTVADSQALSRFSNTSLVEAVNSKAGARMEERSPGSYRFSIRGSALRSPYGVRNVKVYYAGIPLTAPGGATMLNMLAFSNIEKLEIIRGPAGSVYGAGTSGALLLSPASKKNGLTAFATAGSYGLFSAGMNAGIAKGSIGYSMLRSDGYRKHSSMQRHNFNWDATLLHTRKNKTSIHLLFSDLHYETPGALTQAEFNADPTSARPATGMLPGAEMANASVRQQALYTGIVNEWTAGDGFNNTTSIYGMLGYTTNPTIQNVETKREPHYGGRSVFSWKNAAGSSLFEWNTGIELQHGLYNYRLYNNKNGQADSLRSEDRLEILQSTVFAQLNWQWKKWAATAGVSFNGMRLKFARRQGSKEQKIFRPEAAPRFTLLYQPGQDLTVFVAVSKGFSNPAAEEIFADNNSFNLALQPEKLWNYETGIKGYLLKRVLQFDATFFLARPFNSIVTRRDPAGGNYFINAGKSEQSGMEATMTLMPFKKETHLLYGSQLAVAFTNYRFRYSRFTSNGVDYSGKTQPGTAPATINVLADIQLYERWFMNGTFSFTDKIWLNDDNSAAAGSCTLLALRVGYQKKSERKTFTCFLGADNLLNKVYSLGNDINGFGGRYFNAAPGRSFYVGVNIRLQSAKHYQ